MPWRYGKALWFLALILWKFQRTRAEVGRQCEADGAALQRARNRLLARLGARALRELGGVWPKVGQYMSSQGHQWPDEVIAEMSKLRDAMTAAPFKVVRQTIEKDLLRSLDDLFDSFEAQAIASASIAQVHRAVLKDGAVVAVKVQHQDVAWKIPWDLCFMRRYAELVKLISRGEFDLLPMINEWLAAVVEELDFGREADSLQRGRAALEAAGVDVVVPKVYPSMSGRRVLVMEFIEGVPLASGSVALTDEDRTGILSDLVHAYAVGLFVIGHFNADPHGGNLLIQHPKGSGRPRCVLLDWGLTKSLGDDRRLALCRLMVAVGMKDTCGIVEAFSGLGIQFATDKGDPVPDILLAILRHMSLIEKKHISRETNTKHLETLKRMSGGLEDLVTQLDGYSGDFFFVMRIATLIKGLAAVLDVRAHFLDIFVERSRNTLRGPQPAIPPALALPRIGCLHAWLSTEAEKARLEGAAVGVQVAVAGAGDVHASFASGAVAYTSWQQLKTGDVFPLGSPWLARPLLAAATARALQHRGINLSDCAKAVWAGCPHSLGCALVCDIIDGTSSTSCIAPPPRPSAKLLANCDDLISWEEQAPPLAKGAMPPPWWPPAAHAAMCAAMLRSAAAGTLHEALQGLFDEAGAAESLKPASESHVLISKPVQSVDLEEVDASHETLLASLGSEALQCAHLSDVCLANSKALRSSSGMPCGLASSAEALSTVLSFALRTGYLSKRFLDGAGDLGRLTCSQNDTVVVVLMTSANADLARRLGDLAVRA